MKARAKNILLMLVIVLLAGCATLFEPERDPASAYDRGYSTSGTDDDKASEDDSDCVGRFCVPKNTHSQKNDESKNYYLPNEISTRVKQAIESRDIILGMTRKQVAESWGEPTAREVAGDGSGGHERWHYGSRYSLHGERILIFENGRVAGWYR